MLTERARIVVELGVVSIVAVDGICFVMSHAVAVVFIALWTTRC
jgi:hypothetical protein